jgi:putative heme-binding domain-containing protein
VEAPLSARLLATEFLGYHAPAGAPEVLVGLIGGPGSRDLQLAAVRSLKRCEDGAALLANSLERWPSWTAAVREVALAEFLPDVRFARAFLTGVERGSVTATALSVEARKRLLQHKEETVRQRAEALFTEAERDRMKVLAEFRPAITLRGDPEKGHAVFRELCAPCHRLEREGTALGPDLFGVRNQTRETLLLHIIVPNREVASGFEATVVVTDRGEALSGMVTSETATSVTLIEKGGVERTLLRDEIVSMTVSPISLMPEGLEASTTVQGMADLLAYLRGEG